MSEEPENDSVLVHQLLDLVYFVNFDKDLVNVHVSQILGGDILAGGWRKGDRVRTRIDLKVKNVGESTVGAIE